MRFFLSLPWKFLLLLTVLMATVLVVMTWGWISRANQDFVQRQDEILLRNTQQYNLLNQILTNRLESWLQGFASVLEHPRDHQQAIVDGLNSQWQDLQFQWQVTELWFYDSQGELVYQSGMDVPEYIARGAQQVAEQQASHSNIFCEPQCEIGLFTPILTAQDKIVVVAVTMSMLETLAFLNQASQADVSLVRASADTASAASLSISGRVSQSRRMLLDSVLRSLPPTLTKEHLIDPGYHLEKDDQHYLLNLIPVQQTNKVEHFLILVQNITAISEAYSAYRQKILRVALLIFLLAGALLYALVHSFRNRLIMLANRLPLLARHQYHVFDEQRKAKPRLVEDELDVLQNSASSLATQLRSLHDMVIQRTNELEHIAMYDPLTRLPNRNMLEYQLRDAIKGLMRSEGYVVLMFLDLDDFKKVNDSHGHNIGDLLLVEAAHRLSKEIRKTDLVCRFGGDEFVVVLRHLVDFEGALQVADKILDCFREPLRVEEHRFYVSASIGLAVTHEASSTPEQLISHADIAMYAAKHAGGSCYKLYDQDMSNVAINKVAFEAEAREAIENAQFSFALQPQVDIHDGKLLGFEALLRWHHPVKGNIPPVEFIPVLESTEFFKQIGYWVIEHAFELLQQLQNAGYPELKMAINLSASQFLDTNLIPFLQAKLKAHQLHPRYIELELTERTLVKDAEATLDTMRALKELGFLIAIDDFGTGYSSLSYLKNMPIDVVKIDRTFVNGMLHNEADTQIVISTIKMVQNLGLTAVAEGVETEAQMMFLREYNCHMAQGYHISRPVHERELLAVMAESVIEGVWQVAEPDEPAVLRHLQ